MNQLSICAPINSVSFGQVSTAILRELYNTGSFPNVFPIGPIDLSTQKPDDSFNKWLSACISQANKRHKRTDRSFRLWHIQGSFDSTSIEGNDLMTYFELDALQPAEINILKQQRKVYVTSKFTQSIFKQYGIDSLHVPLGFDKYNFRTLDKRPRVDGCISMSIFGKWEQRKAIPKMLRLWAAKYGNNKDYRLNCFVHNPFVRPEDMNALIQQTLQGKQYWNIQFFPHIATNAEFNSCLQSSEIVLSMSGGEGFDLCCYHATALGAWPVALNAHVYQDYLNNSNAVLVQPNSKRRATDGMFFHEGADFNCGNLFDFADDDFYAGIEMAIKNVRDIGVNSNGFKLQDHTYDATAGMILSGLING